MKIVVLGAGPAGVAAAYYLRQKGHDDVTLVDRRDVLGGCAHTLFYDTIPFEFGPQIMFTREDYLRREFEKFLTQHSPRTPDGNFHYLISTDGTLNDLHNFPITADNVLKLPNPQQVILELYELNLQNPSYENFETYCLSVLGPTLYETYVRGYTEKAWCRPSTEIDTDWVKYRPLRLQKTRSRFEGQWQGHPGNYNPMWEKMAEGCTILRGDVSVDDNYGFRIDGDPVAADLVISTLPIRNDLEFVNTFLLYVVIESETFVAKSAFTTFPNNYSFVRMFEYKQQFYTESPYTLLSFDFPYVGTADEARFVEEARAFCRAVLNKEIKEHWVDNRVKIYPLASRENMQRYDAALDDIASLPVVPTGRAGMHAYVSKDTCLRMGMEIANHLDDLMDPAKKKARLQHIRRDLH